VVATSLDGYIAGPNGEVPPPARQVKLRLTGHKVYKTGIVAMEYAVT